MIGDARWTGGTPAIGVPIARVLGIEIRVQLGWVLVLAFVGALAVNEIEQVAPELDTGIASGLGALVAAGFFVSSVAHDLVHAVVARSRGIGVSSIAVSFFGGSTPLDPMAANARDDLAIAASGPLASLAIAGICGVLAIFIGPIGGTFELVAISLTTLLVLNLLLGGINLVPAYPLDGGRIVRAIAWRRTGSEVSGWRAAALSGRIAGFFALALGVAVLLFFNAVNGAMIAISGWFLVLSARAIRDRIRVDELIGDLHVSDAMDESKVTVGPTLTVDTFAAQLLDGETPTTAVPVVDDGRVVGLVGVRQVQRLRRDRWAATRVTDVMVKPPRLVLIRSDDRLSDAIVKLQRANTDGLPVVDGDELLGVMSRYSVGKVVSERMGKADTPPAS